MSKKQDLRAQFEKADAEHTANADKCQESANRRAVLLKQLEDSDTAPEAIEPLVSEPPSEQ